MGATAFFSARSHTGRVRSNNEDNLYCNGAALTPENRDTPFALSGSAKAPCIFAVCDGMGGEEDGEFASLTAVTALAEYAEAIRSAASADEINAAVGKFVTDANSRLCGVMRAKRALMGTTLALVVIAGAVYSYNLGDSRLYVLQSGRLTRVSEDHTLTEQKVKMGLLSKAEARRDRDRNKLTRHLGIFEDETAVTPAIAEPLPLDGGCRILLCSDGLTDMMEDAEIEKILRSEPLAEDAAERLLTEALENGGKDNVTCVVLDVKEL